MANTSARIPIRPSAPCSRVTPASSDGSPSQVAAGCPAGPPLVGDQNFDFARWNFELTRRIKEIGRAKDIAPAPDLMVARSVHDWHDDACCGRGLVHARMRGARLS